MKKIIFLIVAIISLLIISNDAKATCPEGLAQRTNQIMVNGCAYDVDICYKCITLDNVVRVMVNGVIKVDPSYYQSWTWDQVIQGVFNVVFAPNYILTIIHIFFIRHFVVHKGIIC